LLIKNQVNTSYLTVGSSRVSSQI